MYKRQASGSTGDNATGAATPQVIPAPGTYESCTAYFGLTKGSSDLVSYEVKTVGPVAPDPVLGTNLVPILTVQGSGGEVQCIPELAWTDEASWASWIGFSAEAFTYPGTGYYLIPSTYGAVFTTPDGPYTATSTSIRFETSIEGVTVTWTPAGPPATENGWDPFGSIALTPTSNAMPQTLAALAAAGGADAATQAEQMLVDETCDDTDPGLPALATALGNIYGTEFSATCSGVDIALWVFYRSELFDLMVERSLVVVTLTAPTPTTTSGAVSGDSVVAPSFTG